MKRVLRAAFRRLLFLFAILTVVAIWRPDWRRAAQRAAAPYVERAAAPLLERGASVLERAAAPLRRRARAFRREPPAGGATRVSPSREEARPPGPDSSTEESSPPKTPDEEGGSSSGEREEERVMPSGNLPPRLPSLRPSPPLSPELRRRRALAEASPSAAGFRQLADAAAAAGFPEIAAGAYGREAAVYRRLGDPNAATVEELKAGRYRAEGRLYLHAPEPPPASLYTRARLEPPYGAYLGAFIDRDDQIAATFTDENWQTHREAEEFENLAGKKHASLFCYLQYGQKFPFRWAERLRDASHIPHIAWEPRSLADVTDASLDRFAGALARFDAPIFLRFAGEMNGDWTPYHDNPSLYRQKFRLVHRVLAQRAPKAALIWCVNDFPETGIEAYYPGDDAVDWVGVNLYNVLYFDNDAQRPADRVHPVDLLQGVYTRYAARKPIAICEYAASHRAAVDPRLRPDFAATRLAQLYAALPRLFPRVKLVDWYDCDNLRHARPGRQLNDYSLTNDPTVLAAYRKAVAPDYFLGRPDDRPGPTIRPLRDNEPLSGIVTLSAWVRAPIDRPRVYLLADDQVLYAGDEPGPHVARWDTRRAAPGPHTLCLLVTGRDNRRLFEQRLRVTTRDQRRLTGDERPTG